MGVPLSKFGLILSTATIVLFAGLGQLVHWRTHGAAETHVQLAALPKQIGEWTSIEADPLDAKSQDILRLDQFIRRLYKNAAGESVYVYIGYWKKQSGEHQAAKHSPLMCLPANGWQISTPQQKTIASQTARQIAGVIQDHTVLFYYWFFSGEQTYVDETEALFRIMHETIFNARSDGGIVELSTELHGGGPEEEKKAVAVMDSFVKEFAPALQAVVRER